MKQCSVEDCDRPARAKQLCPRHYECHRLWGTTELRRRPEKPPACTIEGCGKPVRARGWCAGHYRRWRVYGDATHVARHSMPSGPAACAWKGNEIGYSGSHRRVGAIRGSASAHQCSSPGCASNASHWALRWDAVGVRRDEHGYRYSPNVWAYSPMCVRDHSRVDHERPNSSPAHRD